MGTNQLQKWALVAEIIGGIAVVATLAILIAETRNNTQVLRAVTYDSIIADMANLRMTQVGNSELHEIEFLFATEGFAELTPRQQYTRVRSFIPFWLQYERAFIQWQNGNLDDDAWERFRRILCQNSGNPTFERTIGVELDGITTDAFRMYRMTECAE